MGISLYSARTFGSRIAQVFALTSIIVLTACEDVTAPDTEAALAGPRLAQSTTGDALASLSSSLDDMTVWSLATLQDPSQRGNIVGILNGLKGHLKTGNVALCQEDLTQAYGIMAALSDTQQVELGPVTVALDLVQYTLKGGTP